MYELYASLNDAIARSPYQNPHILAQMLHGETRKNKKHAHGAGTLPGDERVTARGKRQMIQAAEQVGKAALVLSAHTSGLYPVIVCASSNERCVNSGNIFVSHLRQRVADSKVSVQMNTFPELKGIGMGPYEGMRYDEIARVNHKFVRDTFAWMEGQLPRPPFLADGENPNAYWWRLCHVTDYMFQMLRHHRNGAFVLSIISNSTHIALSSMFTLSSENDLGPDGLPSRIPYYEPERGVITTWGIGDEALTEPEFYPAPPQRDAGDYQIGPSYMAAV